MDQVKYKEYKLSRGECRDVGAVWGGRDLERKCPRGSQMCLTLTSSVTSDTFTIFTIVIFQECNYWELFYRALIPCPTSSVTRPMLTASWGEPKYVQYC